MSFFQKLKSEEGLEITEEQEEKPRKEKAPKLKKIALEKISAAEEEKPAAEQVSKQKKVFGLAKAEGQLVVDVYKANSEFCVQAPIAGVEQEDIDISIENEMLVIRGERKEPDEGIEKQYLYQECHWGPFSKKIILPEGTDTQKIKASLQKGILIVKIPLTQKIKKKKVSVEVEE